ncbi:four helix bundle protein [Sanyastnella coralliicola]|uniref:four helix bundle protein n=1 Tax=Sanyastnella coralliicola TaxID=3069118 RepID=UPI0027B87F2A|nr:four helix bundle protein [Longitalea sp. SCSIO 12813]
MSWVNELEERMITFSADVCTEMNRYEENYAVVNLGRQLMRSATSVTLNFAEARAAESSKDFIHKLKLALKELNETKVGLKLIAKIDPARGQRLETILAEAGELTGILLVSIQTAKKNSLKQ